MPCLSDSRCSLISGMFSDGQMNVAHKASDSRMVRRAANSRIGMFEP